MEPFTISTRFVDNFSDDTVKYFRTLLIELFFKTFFQKILSNVLKSHEFEFLFINVEKQMPTI